LAKTYSPSTVIFIQSLLDALPISNRGIFGLLLVISTTALSHRLASTLGLIAMPCVYRSSIFGSCFAPNEAHTFSRRQMACTFITDRKCTRLNSSHQIMSYAVFCLK